MLILELVSVLGISTRVASQKGLTALDNCLQTIAWSLFQRIVAGVKCTEHWPSRSQETGSCPYELAEEGDEERTRVNIWETIEMVVVYIFIAPTCIGEFNCRLIGEARLNALDYREESRK